MFMKKFCNRSFKSLCLVFLSAVMFLSSFLSLPVYADLRGFLITREARSFYQRFGFEVVNDRIMVKPPRGDV